METSLAFINDPRFNQIVELPAGTIPGRDTPFTVTYADYGYRNEIHPEEENVFLFFGALTSSRFLHIAKDDLAKKHKVRIINPDRPDVGGTDGCDAKDSLVVWRAVVPALLRHLGIRRVSFGCHSGGTVYALDALLHLPALLDSETPYIAIGAPWMLPSHTGSTVFAIVKSLPAGMIGSTDKLVRLINNYVGPVIGASMGISAAVAAKVRPVGPPKALGDSEGVGVDPVGGKLEDSLQNAIMKQMYSYNLKGLSTDALLLMKKVPGWGDWGDYDTLIPRLAESLRANSRRLRVDVFYSETDMLVGDGADSKGARWFDGLWKAPGCTEVIEYHSEPVKGADHDGAWSLRWGAVQKVFQQVGQPLAEQASSSSLGETGAHKRT